MEKHIRFDWAMKRLLRQKSNFVILEGFLSELLKQDISIIEIIESESNKKHEKDKFNRVDLLVKSSKGELMLIEVQNERENDFFHRMNYGQAKLISEHIDSGDKYRKIKKVYSINIVYFELGQGKDYVYLGKTSFRGIHEDDILELSEKQKKAFPHIKEVSDIFATMYLIKVNNFDDVAKDRLDEWIYFLKNSEIKSEFKAKGLQEAKEKMRVDNLERGEKYDYEAFIKEQRIKDAEIETAIFDGRYLAEMELLPIIEQERKKVEQKELELNKERQKLIATIKNMKEDGLSIEKISKLTGESIENIKNILNK